MIYRLTILLAAVLCLASGCATMMPYGDTYDCPQKEKGSCVSVEAAHDYAVSGSFPAVMGRAAPAASDTELGSAIEKYRKAILKGKNEDIEKTQKELLQIISPNQVDEFAEALEQFKAALKGKDNAKVTKAESKLHGIHARAVANARDDARLEYNISNESTRQEFLGRYAHGQRSPAVLMPPIIMETHILPYQTEFDTLAGERTMWIPVEPARWTWPDKFSGGRGDEIGSATKGK